MFITLSSCDVNEPKKDKPKPEGYQEDILWPSLADSPWPMFHHDPQSSGRSKYSGPILGLLEWEFKNSWKQILSGIIVDSDSTIYAPYENGGFVALKSNGNLKWKILEEITHSATTPIITSQGTILHLALSGVYSIYPNGTVKWFYPINIDTYGMNIDKDGNIYFITHHTLYALNKSGQFLWSYSNTEFEGGCYTSFSPDGKTLYIPGNINTPGLIAFDIVNKTIKWKFGHGSTSWCLVDSHGNIWLNAIFDSISKNYTMFSLTPDGNIRWFKKLAHDIAAPTMDKNGNIFFVSDSIYSIDYHGKLRWGFRFETDGYVTTPLVSDLNGNIYVIKEKYEKFDLTVFKNDGQILFNIPNLKYYPGQSPAIGFNRLFIPMGKGESIYSVK